MNTFWKILLVDDTATIDVVTFCNHSAISIFLDKVAIAEVVDIRTFKTGAVLVFLDGLAISLTVFVGSTETASIGKANRHITIKMAI